MKFKATLTLILSALLMLGCSSCVWSTKPIPDEQLPKKDELTEKRQEDTVEPGENTEPKDNALPEYTELGENLEFFHTPNDDCVIVYNHENAWAFDYKLNKVTKLTDFDAMYAVADIHGRAKQYFESYTLGVECIMNQTYEIRVMYTVNSTTHDASYTVYSFYTLESIASYERGEVRGYFYENIEYPGSDEPIVIYDVADLGLLLNNDKTYTDYYSRMVNALVELDIPTLESIMRTSEGALSEWENVVISDYSISNEHPTSPYLDTLLLTINISESTVERYPVGEYKIIMSEGIGPIFSPVFDDADDAPLSGSEEFIYTWASRFGGSYPIELQTMTYDGYSHEMIDFYLNREVETPTLERFEKFCKDTFGYTLEGSGIDRNSVEKHGGHGGSRVLCDITSTVSAGENYIIEVSFYADQLKSVVSKVYRYHVKCYLDGTCIITACESVYDSGLKTVAWSN